MLNHKPTKMKEQQVVFEGVEIYQQGELVETFIWCLN